MPKTSKKTVARSAAIDKSISAALESLAAASVNGKNAIDARTKVNKQLALSLRRLSKKRATLMRRKKSAAAAAKKSPSVETRKNLRTVTAELAAVTREAAKTRAQKTPIAAELSALKAGQRSAVAYAKAIDAATKVLNKPKKKRRKKRATKAA
ncbi:hypothetical protein ACFL17_09250 [Pseudomonadota bacterium]